ncbi:MAG TPA: enoyl-CoA hydratase [Burkholderiales bacterium]|nr:enoyl-CoA hydratase [Burkholderiales bacterium]
MPELLVRRDGTVGTIVFSNPAKLNAVSIDMWQAMPRAMAELERDADVRVIVICGDGERAFISGADISQFEQARSNADAQARYNAAVEQGYLAPVRCTKPVIAKIRGICFGGGLGLAAACDVRIAADDALFRMPAARLGLGYNFVGIKRFVDLMGSMNVADIFFSARKFDAADALRMGFVSRVIPAAELEREVDAYCRLVADNAPLTIAAAKRAIREAVTDTATRDLAGLQSMLEACFDSEDYKEGRTAFMEKRAPRFKGR